MKSDIISIAMGELTATFDNEVVKAVRKVGIDVDKEELLKALELYHNLVQCKDCKYWVSDGGALMRCDIHKDPTVPDHYCSYGEEDKDE